MTIEPDHAFLALAALAAVAFILGKRSQKNQIKTLKERLDSERAALFSSSSELFESKQLVDLLGTRCETEKKIKTDLQHELNECRQVEKEMLEKLRTANAKAYEAKRERDEAKYKAEELKLLVEDALGKWKEQSVLLPSLRRWGDRIQKHYDDLIDDELRARPRPAFRAAEHVKEARQEARRWRGETERLRALLYTYESLAPWLAEYTTLTVEDLIEGIEEENKLRELYDAEDDPVALFVPRSEWAQLSEGDRNQLALDRYWCGSRRRTAWTAGVQYERFIGYQHECKGYRVEYHGASLGIDDLGIDLVCTKGSETRIIQCKRLSETKGIPVRENVIAQIYGACRYYALENELPTPPVPVLYTTYECSEPARRFAHHLGVKVFEQVQFKPYPCIKCNVSHLSGERIYHLPFDQQYDATVIGDVKGEFYAATVAEAEEAGFRRAIRWTGGPR